MTTKNKEPLKEIEFVNLVEAEAEVDKSKNKEEAVEQIMDE